MKGLRIYVYKDSLDDCTNNGISSNHKALTLIGDGIDQVFEPDEDAPAVTMLTQPSGYKYLVPCDENAKPLKGWYMMGGNYGKTSDSRFPNTYPLPIHDRLEN